MNVEDLARLASSMNLGTFARSATTGPWWCECGDRGDTTGGFGSCSRCGRKSRAQVEHERAMFAERRRG
jgi:hypothetical protein